MIITDDVDVRLGYRVRLKAHGLETCFAVDGMTAINSARSEKPDLIIFDLGLPAEDHYLVFGQSRGNIQLTHTLSNISRIDFPVIV